MKTPVPESLAQVFSCQFHEILRTPFLPEHLRWLLVICIALTHQAPLQYVFSKHREINYLPITRLSHKSKGKIFTFQVLPLEQKCNFVLATTNYCRLESYNKSNFLSIFHISMFLHLLNPLTTNVPHHIETSQLIYNAN